MAEFFTRHEALLKRAVEAIGARTYFSAYPEVGLSESLWRERQGRRRRGLRSGP